MPKFKTKEEAYDQCIMEGNIIPIAKFEIERAKNTLEIVEEDIETAKDSISKKRWNSGYKSYYDALRELIEAYLSFDKIKSRNHQCLFSYLCIKYPSLELDWNFFEKIRTKRNGINYYSNRVSQENWKEVEIQFQIYINLLKRELKKKIKEYK